MLGATPSPIEADTRLASVCMDGCGNDVDENSAALQPSKSLGPVHASHGHSASTGAVRSDEVSQLLQRHHEQLLKHLDSWMEQLVAIHRSGVTSRPARNSQVGRVFRTSFSAISETGDDIVQGPPIFRSSINSDKPLQNSYVGDCADLAEGNHKDPTASYPADFITEFHRQDSDSGTGVTGMRSSGTNVIEAATKSEGEIVLLDKLRDSGKAVEGDNNSKDQAMTGGTPMTATTSGRSRSLKPMTTVASARASVESLMDQFKRIKRADTESSFDDLERRRRKTAVEVAGHESSRRMTSLGWNNKKIGSLERLVKSFYFEAFFAMAIITNSGVVGVQVEFAAAAPNEGTANEFYVLSFVYTFIFTLELVLRLMVEGRHFFMSAESWHWNFLDVFIVMSSLMEVCLDIVHLVSQKEMAGVGGVSNVRIVRIIRITRLIRIFRIVKIVRFIKALRTLVFSILSTLKSLLWALLLLMMIIYSFGIIFTQSVSTHLAENGFDAEAVLLAPGPRLNPFMLSKYWARLPRSMFTLFKAITGGISWDEVVDPLSDVGEAWVMLFVGFVAFATFAVLNVVTGVFCQSAIESANHDQEMMIQTMMANKKNYIERIQKLFKQVDDDGSGFITISELEAHLDDESVQAYFSSLDLDPKDAWTLFKLLDVDKGNLVDLEEFIIGCMRLKGDAKSIDIAKLTYETKWMMKRLLEFMTYVELQFAVLQGHDPTLTLSNWGLSGGDMGLGSRHSRFTRAYTNQTVGGEEPSSARSSRTGVPHTKMVSVGSTSMSRHEAAVRAALSQPSSINSTASMPRPAVRARSIGPGEMVRDVSFQDQ